MPLIDIDGKNKEDLQATAGIETVTTRLVACMDPESFWAGMLTITSSQLIEEWG